MATSSLVYVSSPRFNYRDIPLMIRNFRAFEPRQILLCKGPDVLAPPHVIASRRPTTRARERVSTLHKHISSLIPASYQACQKSSCPLRTCLSTSLSSSFPTSLPTASLRCVARVKPSNSPRYVLIRHTGALRFEVPLGFLISRLCSMMGLGGRRCIGGC